MDPRWLNLVLGSRWGQEYLESRCFTGSTSQVELSRVELAKMAIPIPALQEQVRIAVGVNSIYALGRSIERSISKLQSVRLGLMQEFMDRVLRGDVEVNWSPVRDVGTVRTGKQLSPDSRAAGGQFPYLRVANVLDGTIDYSDVKSMSFTSKERETFHLRPGDILLNEGQSLELVGRSAIYRRGKGDFCFQNTLIRFRAGEGLDSEYAQVVFNHWLRTGVFSGIAKKTTSIAHLGGDRFGALNFPLVSPGVQANLLSVIRACDAAIERERSELSRIRLLQQGLMNDLLGVQA